MDRCWWTQEVTMVDCKIQFFYESCDLRGKRVDFHMCYTFEERIKVYVGPLLWRIPGQCLHRGYLLI
jgi:hypothetical protein